MAIKSIMGELFIEGEEMSNGLLKQNSAWKKLKKAKRVRLKVVFNKRFNNTPATNATHRAVFDDTSATNTPYGVFVTACPK